MSFKNGLYILWSFSLAAVVGSLFFSEILKVPPCDLCWFQRIFMYPLAIIIPLAILKNDRFILNYILALLIPGSVVALYHNLLFYKILEEPLIPCHSEVPCNSRAFQYFGFLGIPLMSLAAFVAMMGVTLYLMKKEKKTT